MKRTGGVQLAGRLGLGGEGGGWMRVGVHLLPVPAKAASSTAYPPQPRQLAHAAWMHGCESLLDRHGQTTLLRTRQSTCMHPGSKPLKFLPPSAVITCLTLPPASRNRSFSPCIRLCHSTVPARRPLPPFFFLAVRPLPCSTHTIPTYSHTPTPATRFPRRTPLVAHAHAHAPRSPPPSTSRPLIFSLSSSLLFILAVSACWSGRARVCVTRWMKRCAGSNRLGPPTGGGEALRSP